jgi:4'-phosphopantetheinyl transferase EntD
MLPGDATGRRDARLTRELVRRGLPRPVGVGIRWLSETVPPMHPMEEQALGSRAVEGRRTTFALGRAAAREALRELDGVAAVAIRLGLEGVDGVAIPRGTGGEPIWPEGIVGSISHSREVAVAVVARRGDYVGLGVDIEDLGRGPSPRVARLVCRPSEMEWVDPEAGTQRLALLFSAKEAVFKALYPIEGVWLGFADAELTWLADGGGFEARVLKSVGTEYAPGFSLRVNSTLGSTWVLSTAFVPA